MGFSEEARQPERSLAHWITDRSLAPVAELPVVEVVSAVHILADLTLGLGKVVHDYLSQPIGRSGLGTERTPKF